MDFCKVRIVNLGGYVSGVETTLDKKTAEALQKAGQVQILVTESNKIAPDISQKSEEKKHGKK